MVPATCAGPARPPGRSLQQQAAQCRKSSEAQRRQIQVIPVIAVAPFGRPKTLITTTSVRII